MTIAQSIKYIVDRIGRSPSQPVVNQFTFLKADPNFQNLLSDEHFFPVCYLDAPLIGTLDEKTLKLTFDVRIVFLLKSELEYTWFQQEGLLVNTEVYCREFVKLCRDIDPNDSGISGISNVRILEVVNLFDVNATGHYLTARISTMNPKICFNENLGLE